MTGYQSKRAMAQDKLDDDDAQVYIADYESALQKEYQRGYGDGKAAQPAQQEQVAWMTQAKIFVHLLKVTEAQAKLYGWKAVYTTPQPALLLENTH